MVLLLVSGLFVLISMLMSMEEVKEEKSKISVGIADQSGTDLSAMVIETMQQKDLYDIVLGREDELVEKLKLGEISAVCVFKRNFADNLLKGKTKNLVTMYETEDSSALLLGDVLQCKGIPDACKVSKKSGKGRNSFSRRI